MSESQNVTIVQDAFAAFGRGDIQALVSHVDENVIWKGVYGAAAHVPTSGERRGRQAVAEFFSLVGQHVRFSSFEPKTFVASGDTVVALGHYTATTSANRPFDSDFAMVFTLKNNLIVGFQEFTNSAAVNASYPEKVAAASA